MDTLSVLPAPPSPGGAPAAPVAVRRYSSTPEQLHAIMALMGAELSEPYSIFTYRHFLEGWPELCFVVRRRDTAGRRGAARGAGARRRGVARSPSSAG